MGSLSPAPWATDSECGNECVRDAGGFMVADCAIFGRGSSATRNVANARAIASLPALLDFARNRAADGCAEAIAILRDSDTHPKDGDVEHAPLVSGAGPQDIAQGEA